MNRISPSRLKTTGLPSASAGPLTRGENDRPGLGDCQLAAGQNAIESVEVGDGETVVVDDFDATWPPRSGEVSGHAEAADAADEAPRN